MKIYFLAATPYPIIAFIITRELVEARFNENYLSAKPCPIIVFIITRELVEARFNVRFAHSSAFGYAVPFAL